MIGQVSEDVLILTVESSYDETATAVVKNGKTMLPNVTSSQIATHTVYGGVVPEIASREHIKVANYVIGGVLVEARVAPRDITTIGITYGPGLVGALSVGIAGAKAIVYVVGEPLIGVYHTEGHVSVNFIENQDLEPPFVCPVMSRNHTHLVIVKDYGEFETIGRTRGDAAGKASDKMARSMDLGYPGGPKIDKTAKIGNPHAIQSPRGRVEGAPYDFSFSGLKSAMSNHIDHARMTGEKAHIPDLAASFQSSVVESLVSRAILTAREFGYKKLTTADDVASNSTLRKAVTEACEKDGLQFYYSSPIFCADDAVMIGTAACYEYLKGNTSGWDLNAIPNLRLGEC